MPHSGAGWCGWSVIGRIVTGVILSFITQGLDNREGWALSPHNSPWLCGRKGCVRWGWRLSRFTAQEHMRPLVLGGRLQSESNLGVRAQGDLSGLGWRGRATSAAGGFSVPELQMEAIDPALCCVTPSKLHSLSGPPLRNACYLGSRGPTERQAAGRGVLGCPLAPTRSSHGVGVAWVSGLPLPLPLPPQVFSIVVFGSIVNEGYLNTPTEGEEFCIYNRNPSACSYGVTVGVLAFLTCLLYLALDVYFPQISSVKDRKKAVLSDIGVSGEFPAPEGCPSSGPFNPHAHLGGV